MRPDAKLTESPSNGRWAGSRERTRNGQRQAEREMEAEEARNGRPRHIQRAFHSQKSSLLSQAPAEERQGAEIAGGGGRGELIPPPLPPRPSIFQNHLTPPPSSRDVALRPVIGISVQPLTTAERRDLGAPALGTPATRSSPFPHLQAAGFPQPLGRGRGGRSAPSPLFSMGWDFVNEQSRDAASFVRPPPPTTGEAEKEGRGPPPRTRAYWDGTPGFLDALRSPHICFPGGVVP